MEQLLKAPFRSPYTLTVTQEFGNTSNNQWYFEHGITSPFHSGIDVVFGNAKQTYGTECICPFDTAKVVKVTWDSPTSTKGNGVTIESCDIDGIKYQVVCWHTGEIVVKLGQELKLGDVVCYVGNSGLCNPSSTVIAPWNGAHCHLMLFKYVMTKMTNGSQYILQDYDNGVYGSRNPRELFDFTQWTLGTDTGLAHDAWVLKQYINGLSGENLVKYLKILGL